MASRRAWCLILALTLQAAAQDAAPPGARVGIPFTLTDVYIPGGEARPQPRPNRQPPLVIRLLAVKPASGGRRYDFEVYGLEAGRFDLADYLEAADPADPPRFSDIPLTITTELPAGLPRPAELEAAAPKRIGGYKTALWILGVLWAAGLIVLVLWKRRRPTTALAAAAPPSLAERLQTLLTAAARGGLDAEQKARLERLILGYWHERLPDLAALPPSEALAALRHHDKAGPLLRQLETWLHAPNSSVSHDRIDELLAPYRD